jgi:hypothetical protein
LFQRQCSVLFKQRYGDVYLFYIGVVCEMGLTLREDPLGFMIILK